MDNLGLRNEAEFTNEKIFKNEFVSAYALRLGVSRETLIPVSSLLGLGVDFLLRRLTAFAEASFGGTETALVVRERHRSALQAALDALNRALALPARDAEDLVAEELRSAARALGRLTGRIDVEDVLDVVFRDFCIGK